MQEEKLRQVYEMVDSIPLSRPKKNIGRDFSDALMMAEVIHHYQPKMVSLHNYPSTNKTEQKITNWNTLNVKVLKKIGLGLTRQQIEQIANSSPFAIETYLHRVLTKFEAPQEEAKVYSHMEKQPGENVHIPTSTGNMSNLNNPKQSFPARNNNKKNQRTIQMEEKEEVLELIDEIEQAYTHLLKLQETSRLKDQVLKNYEKKIERMIFS